MKYELIRGIPGDIAELKCVECNKVLMEVPVDCVIRPERSVVTDNMRCAMSNHKITVTIRKK